MKNLIIIGVGGFAREVYFHAQNSIGYGTEFVIKGFLDGTVKLLEAEYKKLQLSVLGDVNTYEPQTDDVFVIAIAKPSAKEEIAKIMDAKGIEWWNLIHKTALVHPQAHLGKDIILSMGVGIGPDTNIGNHILINTYSAVGHDTVIGDYSSVMSYVDITGNNKIGRFTYWGSGAHIHPGLIVEDNAVIGMGSIVIKKVKRGVTVFGNPAKKI